MTQLRGAPRAAVPVYHGGTGDSITIPIVVSRRRAILPLGYGRALSGALLASEVSPGVEEGALWGRKPPAGTSSKEQQEMLSPADLVDLHTHSQASDGADTPETLVRSAAEDGIRALALTDHDCIDGLEQFLMACHKYAVAGIPGVEVSVKFMEFRMHIVGLGLR